jgi:hypothetical protein
VEEEEIVRGAQAIAWAVKILAIVLAAALLASGYWFWHQSRN